MSTEQSEIHSATVSKINLKVVFKGKKIIFLAGGSSRISLVIPPTPEAVGRKIPWLKISLAKRTRSCPNNNRIQVKLIFSGIRNHTFA